MVKKRWTRGLMILVIRRANQQDLEGIKQLLMDSGLYHQDLVEHLQHFLVIESSDEERQILGVAGMEVYPPYGLLRSFVLKQGSWSPQMGLQLLQMLLVHAEMMKCDSVFLITSAMTPLFKMLGFALIEEKDLPEPIKKSAHFKSSMKQGVLMVYHSLHRRDLNGVHTDEIYLEDDKRLNWS